MSRLSDWLRQSRLLRIAAVVVTFMLPLTNILSAAVVVMTARGAGPKVAVPEVLIALAVLTGLVLAAGAAQLPAILGAAALWGGGLAAGSILRRFYSVDLAVQALVLLTMAASVLIIALGPDPRTFWQPVLEDLVKQAGLPQQSGLPPDWFATLAALMPGVIAASVLSTLLLALILGVWLDRDKDGSEWRARFLSLRLGLVLSLALLVAVGLILLGFVVVGGALAMVLGTAFAAQGLSVIHWQAERRNWPGIWPLALYGPLLLGPPVAGLILLGVAGIGLADNGYQLRRPGSDVV